MKIISYAIQIEEQIIMCAMSFARPVELPANLAFR